MSTKQPSPCCTQSRRVEHITTSNLLYFQKFIQSSWHLSLSLSLSLSLYDDTTPLLIMMCPAHDVWAAHTSLSPPL
ncbi:hypothetical protein OAV88_01545 [bacterium]|nr:hypothetical protein [bacterium]